MRPGKRLLQLCGLWSLLALVVSLWPVLLPAWWMMSGALGLLALAEALVLRRTPNLSVTRKLSSSLPLGVWKKVRLSIDNRSSHACRCRLFDHHPRHARSKGLPRTITIGSQQRADFSYQILPELRGNLQFGKVQIELQSPWDLWRQTRWAGEVQEIKVYPNFAAVAKYALLATDNRLNQLGIRKRQRRGEGMEFHQLREYRVGDTLRQIDWKATSRHKKLISKEYQEERDQRIVFLLDCGRRMRAEDGALSHFDHALNAMLLLAYVALRQGDAVGLLNFGGPARWMKPCKGVNAMNALLNTVYDLQPSKSTPDFSAAASQLMVRQQKRSLIVLISNLRDEDHDELLPALRLMGQRHLVLAASLREKVLDEVLQQTVTDFAQALRHASVQHYLADRTRSHDRIHGQGAVVLDVTPDQLPVAMVNRYLDIKRSGRL